MAPRQPAKLFVLSNWEVFVILIGSLLTSVVVTNANRILLLEIVVVGPVAILLGVWLRISYVRWRKKPLDALTTAVVITDRWFIKKVVGGVAFWAAFSIWLVVLQVGAPAYALGVIGNVVIIGFLLIAVYGVNLAYATLSAGGVSHLQVKVRRGFPSALLLIGLVLGSSALAFSLWPPARPDSSPVGSPAIVDVGVTAPYSPVSTNVPVINETDFYFEGRTVLLNVTFSNVNSTSEILVLMPFRIQNVSQPFGFGASTLNRGWKFLYHKPSNIGPNYWIENATFTNNIAYPSMKLNGSLTMALNLDNDIFNVGPWQESVLLSFGSNTSPIYSACRGLQACLSAYSGGSRRTNAASFVEINFNQNEIIGDGTFPTPSLVASNNYGRGVAWLLPSSEYFHDLQLFLIANSFAWALPLPNGLQPVLMTFGFVALQACLTKIFVDATKKKTNRSSRIDPLERCYQAEYL